MQANRSANLITLMLVAGASACDSGDAVEPGFYGAPQAQSCAPQPSPSAGAAGTSPAATGMTGGSGGSGSASGMSPGTGTSHAAPMNDAGAAGTGVTTIMDPPSGTGSTSCALGGRWLVTMHLVTEALGEPQYAHYFNYFEIEQHGDAFTITKGLACGYDSIGVGDFAATVDFSATWAASMSKIGYADWAGTSVETDGGCKIDLPKRYTVRGATIPYYLDPSIPLPTADEPAQGTTPGWEDWDGDGNPGITGVLSGLVSGKVFVAPRQWTSVSGTAADVSAIFKIPVDWNQEPNVMSYDGTPLLGSESARASDDSLHFAQFARLADAQATGDDATICKSVVELAPMLTPEAAGN